MKKLFASILGIGQLITACSSNRNKPYQNEFQKNNVYSEIRSYSDKQTEKKMQQTQTYQTNSTEWRGLIKGQVNNQLFQLPITISFIEPLRDENNPVRLIITAGDQNRQVGSLTLASSLQITTPETGRPLTLQYFTINVNENHLEAVLSNEQKAVSAVYNYFVGPNVSADNAPEGPAKQLEEMMGELNGAELFAFYKGMTTTLDVNNQQLIGTIRGRGRSYTSSFGDNVFYEAHFQAKRVR